MLKIVRTAKDDYVCCPSCSAKNFFLNSVAPIICKGCNTLLPDADAMGIARGTEERLNYFLDELLYD
jgi:hypothetical protein